MLVVLLLAVTAAATAADAASAAATALFLAAAAAVATAAAAAATNAVAKLPLLLPPSWPITHLLAVAAGRYCHRRCSRRLIPQPPPVAATDSTEQYQQ